MTTLTGQDIAEAQGAVQALLEAGLDGTRTSGNEFVALRVVAFRGPWESDALPAYLAGQRQLGLTPAQATDLVTGLRNQDLITLDPVTLTEQGRTLLTELAAKSGELSRQVFGGIAPDDLATAHRVLALVTERATRVSSGA